MVAPVVEVTLMMMVITKVLMVTFVQTMVGEGTIDRSWAIFVSRIEISSAAAAAPALAAAAAFVAEALVAVVFAVEAMAAVVFAVEAMVAVVFAVEAMAAVVFAVVFAVEALVAVAAPAPDDRRCSSCCGSGFKCSCL